MRIDYLLLDASVGGGTVRTTFTMSEALAARGHRTRVVSLRWSRDPAMLALPAGVPVETLVPRSRANRWLSSLPRTARWVRPHGGSELVGELDAQAWRFTPETDEAMRAHLAATDADVVVATRTGLNLAVAQLDTRAARVVQEHVGLRHLAPAQQQALARHLPGVEAVVSLTRVDARHYRSLLGPRSAVPVHVVPNAVDVPAPGPGVPREPVVLAAGRLAHQKGFDLLVEAWAPVARTHPGWRLVIHGRGGLEQALRAQVAEAGLSNRVLLPGFADDLPARMRSASVFALSSRFEGMPMVMLEAMASGLPIVAFDCPTGPRQLMRHEESGLLVQRGSVPGLSAALERLVADPALRGRLAAGGRHRVEDFSVPRVAARWEQLFAELVG